MSLIRGTPNPLTGTGVDEAMIADAEAGVGTLPHDYRRFLRDVGWAMLGGTAVWGLGDGFPYDESFVELTLSERERYGLPSHLIAFSNNGAGDMLCFARQDDGATDERVFVHLHETRRTVAEAGSFLEWLARRASVERVIRR
ncbi:SMI1/KNR4 family protein [Microbacterium sp. B19]|uniref:SMI1/KNR4 family protein n=1 Tax=Microbacterium sp. B19 TaxID=96765 RepID=UPI000346C51B|nr:SMI1/KNR4 family protein [Microbacterium sp. B19]